eukprot:752987-Hanusia_phi.AAC.1
MMTTSCTSHSRLKQTRKRQKLLSGRSSFLFPHHLQTTQADHRVTHLSRLPPENTGRQHTVPY